jgi:hypothetical protein
MGGWANGIPRYSDTSGFQREAWPTTEPLDVFTLCPTFQTGCWNEEPVASWATANADTIDPDADGILNISGLSKI